MTQMVKNPPVMWETQVQSLGREVPLEKEMATHSSTLALGNPMDRGAWRAAVHGVAEGRIPLSDRHSLPSLHSCQGAGLYHRTRKLPHASF